ncbi:hypothetical protein ONZ45_g10702 [Pleurotus djamor]|nr:hypothetical protein ONZ45_g10702 [Pleurotus djamor]
MFDEHTINDSSQWPRLLRDSADLNHRIQSYSKDAHPFGGIVASPYPAVNGVPLPPALFEWYIRTHNLSPRCLHGLLAAVKITPTISLACPLRYDACPWSVCVVDAYTHAQRYGYAEYPHYRSSGDDNNPGEDLNFIDIDLDVDFHPRDSQGMDDADAEVEQEGTNGREVGEDRDLDDSDTDPGESAQQTSHTRYDDDEPVYDIRPHEGFIRVKGPCIPYGEHYSPPDGGHHALWALSGDGLDEKTFRSLFIQCPSCNAYMLGDAYPDHDCSAVVDTVLACRSMLMKDGLTPNHFHGLFGRCLFAKLPLNLPVTLCVVIP